MDTPRTSEPPPAVEPVWRIADVAAYWQRDPRTILRWIKAGDHPAPRTDPDGNPYWLAAEVRAFAATPDGDRHRNTTVAASTEAGLHFPLTVG